MMLNNKSFLKIISLLIAIFLWIYVMGEVNPESKGKINNVEVSFINTETLAEQELAVVQEKEITINVTIQGKRSDVNEVKNNGLTATVDVADCREGSNTEEIQVNLPDGVTLESLSEDALTFTVEELVEEEKPVIIEFLGNGESADLIPWEIETTPETVEVRGAKSSVERIQSLSGNVAQSAVTEEGNTVDVALTPVTKRGDPVYGIQIETPNVQTKVQLLSMKTVDLNLSTENLGEDLAVDKIRGADSVRIVGPRALLEDMEELTGVIDLAGITSAASVEVKVSLPDNIYLYDETAPPMAEITLKAAE